MAMKTVAGDHGSVHKGRGATLNPEGRFEKDAREAFDDGWDTPLEEEPGRPLTIVTVERARSIISRNQSPDLPFTQSINPYRGCEHGCIYCLAGETPILMGDGRIRPLEEVKVGDELYGTERRGWYRRYVKTRVLARWSVIKPAYRIVLEDGTCITAGADHRFLTDRGWKFVTGTEIGTNLPRPHLTARNKMMGTGSFAAVPMRDQDYREGYLRGLIRGDGLLASYRYTRSGRAQGDQHQFRLALCDEEALRRARQYLIERQVATQEFLFQEAAAGRRAMRAIRTHAISSVERVRRLVAWPIAPSRSWYSGFLAGMFDAEGCYSQGVLRISNTDQQIIDRIGDALREWQFRFVVEHTRRDAAKPVAVVRVVGGLREHLRFFHSVEPAITRKREILGQAVKSAARLRVVSVEPIGKSMRLYDIATTSEDFIANGVVSHNCYARPSHAYLNLSPGLDFETRLFAKTNAAELLQEELARPGYVCDCITIGANTDPYQPVEREWKVTRSILEVLAACNHPCAIITKNAMVERDLDILAPMAAKNLVQVYISVTTLDHDIARRMEPRASAPARRVEAIRRLAEAGVPTGVMVAPVVPFLTDSGIETVLAAAREAGADRAGYTLMRLPWEVKDLFKDWLEHNFPLKAAHVMSRVREMRDGRENDPNFGSRMRGAGELAELLSKRFNMACRRLALNHIRRGPLDTAKFRPPRLDGQMDLF
jgi:DNA repair photolyase